LLQSTVDGGVVPNLMFAYVFIEAVMRGLHISGMGNFSERLNGVALGLYNKSDYTKGIQLGLVNRSRQLKGLQIGLFNVSEAVSGLQIGIWNKNARRSFPFINF